MGTDYYARKRLVFNKQFSRWEKALKGGKFEDLYKKVHANIRAGPARTKSTPGKPVRKVVSTHTGYRILANSKNNKWIKLDKLTHEQRGERVQAKMLIISEAAAQ